MGVLNTHVLTSSAAWILTSYVSDKKKSLPRYPQTEMRIISSFFRPILNVLAPIDPGAHVFYDFERSGSVESVRFPGIPDFWGHAQDYIQDISAHFVQYLYQIIQECLRILLNYYYS